MRGGFVMHRESADSSTQGASRSVAFCLERAKRCLLTAILGVGMGHEQSLELSYKILRANWFNEH